MLSILIPIFNYDVRLLVQTIHKQCLDTKLPFEILLLDDCSSNASIRDSNSELARLVHVHHFQNKENQGNAKTRINIYKKARYDWLLFLDADVEPVNQNFISKYIEEMNNGTYSVLAGDILYKNDTVNKEFRLKVKHGSKYEVLPPDYIENDPLGLHGANFAIKRDVFSPDFFMPLPNSYGYVDTVFGLLLAENKIPLKLLRNPVYHLGIENSTSFLRKTKLAIENCHYLLNHHPQIASELKVARAFLLLKKVKLNGLTATGFKIFCPLIERNLHSNSPSLRLFQLYKLGYLCSLDKFS